MNRSALLAAAVLAVLVPVSASATSIIPSNLCVDFRTEAWAPAYGQHSWTVGDVTAYAYPSEAELYQDSVDGLGILGGENDEIDHLERLKVSFTAPKILSGAWVTDLFEAPDGGIGEKGIAKVRLFDDSEQLFYFDGNNSHQANGEQFIDFGGPLSVKYVKFYANNSFTDIQSCNNEFSVAGLTCSPTVPEPTTMILLGLGLAGGGLAARRRRS